MVMARPLCLRSRYKSQKTPPETVCGAAAAQPNRKRNNRNVPQLGASPQPSVKAVCTEKLTRKTGRRPQDSESGAKIIGPKTGE